MKKVLIIAAIVMFAAASPAQNPEYLQQKDFRAEKQKIMEGINASKKQVNDLKKNNELLRKDLDSLQWKHGYTDGKLGMVSDSLNATSARLVALQEKVDSRKVMPTGIRMALFVILAAVIVIQFILLFLFRKRAADTVKELTDRIEAIKDNQEKEIKAVHVEVKAGKDYSASVAGELSAKLSSSLAGMEARFQSQEQKLEEKVGLIGNRMDTVEPAIGKLREDQANAATRMEDGLASLKQELGKKILELSTGHGKKE